MKSSAVLYDYYQWWMAGNGPHPGMGLCNNISQYVIATGQNISGRELRHEMAQQFVALGLDRDFPFNKSESSYFEECGHEATRFNMNRVQFVRDRIVAGVMEEE